MVNNLRCDYLVTYAVSDVTIHIVTKYFSWSCVNLDSYSNCKQTDNKKLTEIGKKILHKTGLLITLIGDYSNVSTEENLALNKRYEEVLECKYYNPKAKGGSCTISQKRRGKGRLVFGVIGSYSKMLKSSEN